MTELRGPRNRAGNNGREAHESCRAPLTTWTVNTAQRSPPAFFVYGSGGCAISLSRSRQLSSDSRVHCAPDARELSRGAASRGKNGASVQPTIFASLIAAQGDEEGGGLRDERLRAPTILVNATRLLPRGLFIKRTHFEGYLVVVGGFFSRLDAERPEGGINVR